MKEYKVWIRGDSWLGLQSSIIGWVNRTWPDMRVNTTGQEYDYDVDYLDADTSTSGLAGAWVYFKDRALAMSFKLGYPCDK